MVRVRSCQCRMADSREPHEDGRAAHRAARAPGAGDSARARAARKARALRVSVTSDSRSPEDRKSTRLNSSHLVISYAVFCLKKKNNPTTFIQAHQPPKRVARGTRFL